MLLMVLKGHVYGNWSVYDVIKEYPHNFTFRKFALLKCVEEPILNLRAIDNLNQGPI